MSNLGSIHAYRSEVDKIIRFGGSRNETTIRRAFSTLINAYDRAQAKRIMDAAHQTCPYSKALRGDTVVTLVVD